MFTIGEFALHGRVSVRMLRHYDALGLLRPARSSCTPPSRWRTWPDGDHGFAVVDLPRVDAAAAMIHRGSMDDVLPTAQALARWIDANGYRCAGYAREVTLECSGDRSKWVTELQHPINASGG